MTAEYTAFSRPAFTAADFERADAEATSDSPMFAPPIYGRENGAARHGGTSPMAWIAVPVIALALAAGVYALNLPHRNTGVAQLTPGQPAAAPMQAVPVQTARTDPTASTPAASERMAPETPKAPIRTAEASPRITAKVAAPRHVVTRSAPSAADTGTNASAAVPAPAPVVVAPPPPVVTATPEVAPQPAPQPVPETPPTAPPHS